MAGYIVGADAGGDNGQRKAVSYQPSGSAGRMVDWPMARDWARHESWTLDWGRRDVKYRIANDEQRIMAAGVSGDSRGSGGANAVRKRGREPGLMPELGRENDALRGCGPGQSEDHRVPQDDEQQLLEIRPDAGRTRRCEQSSPQVGWAF